MRVIVVDQDSALLEAIARSLRDRYTVDAVTNKGDCLDLLKQNTFEVIVAGERLEDGSGLELLSQCAKRWASMLRIFAADRPRLQLLKGRLGPFQLFQTLAYPIDPDRLLATLELAEAAQHANADTANIQHVVLGAEVFAGEGDESPFPPPRPEPRVAPALERPTPAARSLPRARRSQRVAGAAHSARLRTSSAAAVAEVPDPPPPEELAATKRNPVRFPARIQPTSEALRTVASGPEDVLAEAAELAREALSPLVLEPNHRKRALVITAVALALGLIVVGLKVMGARPASASIGPLAAVRASPAAAPEHSKPEAAPLIGTNENAQSQTAIAASAISASAVTAAAVTTLHPSLSDTPRHAHHRPAAIAATASNSGTNILAHPGASPPALPPETPVGLTMAPRETLPVGNTAAARSDSSESVASSGSGEGRGASVPVPTASGAPAASGTPAASAVPPTKAAAPSSAAANTASNTQRSSNSDEPPPVIREAKLIRAVRADYPSAARRDGIEGYVELALTVSAQGAVTNVTVSRASPPGVFEKAALTAVRHYRYDPRYVDGLPAEAHLQVRLDFSPAQDTR